MQFALTVVITVGLVVLALGQQQYIHIAVFSTDFQHLDIIAPGVERALDEPTVLSMRNGYKLWAKLVNEQGGITVGGIKYLVNLTEHHIGDAKTPQLVDYAMRVVDEVGSGKRGPVHIAFGPFGSVLTNVTMIAWEKYDKLMIASSSTSSSNFICFGNTLHLQPPCKRDGELRFRNLYAVSSIASNALKTSTQFLSIRPDVKTFAAWAEDQPYLQELVDAALNVAQQYKHTVLTKLTVQRRPEREHILAIAREMQRLNPDVIVAGNEYEACKLFVRALKEINYLPKALLMPNCIDFPYAPADLGNLSDYLMGMALWDKRLTGQNYEDRHFFPPEEGLGSAMKFYNKYVEEYNSEPTIYSALAFQVGETFMELLAKTDSLDPEAWHNAMPTLQFNTFFGPVQFNGYHQNIGLREITLQQIRGKLEIVDPLSAATSAFVYPMPSWDDREFKSTYLGKPMELAIAAVSVVVVFLLIALAFIIVIRRKAAVITAASPVFCLLIIIGSILPIVGIFSWMLHAETPLCHLRIWTLNLGFSVVYGAIFTKTWRVLRIFMNKSLAARNVSVSEIAIIEALIVGIDVILCAVWSAVTRPVAEKIVIDPVHETKNYVECVPAEPLADFIFFIIAAVSKGIFMIVGIVITFKVRKVKYLLFNESKWIGYSIYNLFVFLIVLVPLQFMDTERETLFFIRSLFILIIVLATNLLIFGPKLWILFGPQKGGTILMSSIQAGSELMTVAEGGAMGQTVVDDKGDDKIEQLNETINELKKKNKRLQKRIKELEEQVHAQDRSAVTMSGHGDTHVSETTTSEQNQSENVEQESDASQRASSPRPNTIRPNKKRPTRRDVSEG